jgi:hypothetical protein
MKSTYNRAEHQRQRAEIERHFGGLDKATDLRNIGVDSPFALRAFVDHIRNVDVVMAFHGSTPEWTCPALVERDWLIWRPFFRTEPGL